MAEPRLEGGSVRADGSVRPVVKIRPGFTPELEARIPYRSPGKEWADRERQNQTGSPVGTSRPIPGMNTPKSSPTAPKPRQVPGMTSPASPTQPPNPAQNHKKVVSPAPPRQVPGMSSPTQIPKSKHAPEPASPPIYQPKIQSTENPNEKSLETMTAPVAEVAAPSSTLGATNTPPEPRKIWPAEAPIPATTPTPSPNYNKGPNNRNRNQNRGGPGPKPQQGASRGGPKPPQNNPNTKNKPATRPAPAMQWNEVSPKQ